MSKVTAADLRNLSEGDLEARISQLRAERLQLGFREATETIENPMRFRTIRREIARALTILGEKRRKAQGE